MHLYRRRLQRRFANDPAGARAYVDRADRRLVRWAKWDGLFIAAILVALLVVLVVLAATGNTSP